MDQMNLKAWEGRVVAEAGAVSREAAVAFHATLGDARASAPKLGDPIPALAHWCAFPPDVHQTELGADGHPGGGGLLPPVRLQRRMWVGGALRFGAPLHVGEPLERRTSIRNVTEKEGRSGPMVFVTLDHAIYGERGLAISERQDIVYLEIPDQFRPPPKQTMPSEPLFSQRVAMSETLLFRYSALTFNAHRIHYDAAYTREVEHYPGLVVHGPLQATLLMKAAVARMGRVPDHFQFRGVHPLFVGTDLDISAVPEVGGLALFAGAEGHQGMQANAIWEGTQ